MRHNIATKHSTKYERILYELLKRNRIPFRHRWIIEGREVDFLVGHYAIELNGHEQDEEKTLMLASNGYVPVHLSNDSLKENIKEIEKWLRTIQSTLTASRSAHAS